MSANSRIEIKEATSKTTNEDDNEDFDVEEVLDMKTINGMRYYLLKWIGYSDEFNTWEPEQNLNCENLINDYLSKRDETQVDKILGATTKTTSQRQDILYFVIQFKTTKKKGLIPVAQAYQRFPRLVISFFEERLQWKYETTPNKMQLLREEEVSKMRAKTHNFRGGFSRNLIPEAICGVINTVEGLLILLKWKDHDLVELLPAIEVHNNCPELLLNYYNDRIDWRDPSYYES